MFTHFGRATQHGERFVCMYQQLHSHAFYLSLFPPSRHHRSIACNTAINTAHRDRRKLISSTDVGTRALRAIEEVPTVQHNVPNQPTLRRLYYDSTQHPGGPFLVALYTRERHSEETRHQRNNTPSQVALARLLTQGSVVSLSLSLSHSVPRLGYYATSISPHYTVGDGWQPRHEGF